MSARDTTTKIVIPPYILPYIHQSRPLKHTSQQSQNPHIVLHFDIIRNTKTLHFEYNTSKAATLDRQYTKTMRGYTGIMGSSDCSCDLNGNGEKVHIQHITSNCLWQPSPNGHKEEPVWHLRVTVLKDQESRADAPGRRFVRSSFLIWKLLLIYVLDLSVYARPHTCLEPARSCLWSII